MERNFETVMIEQCAPVLASLKPAGLFRYETRDCADLAPVLIWLEHAYLSRTARRVIQCLHKVNADPGEQPDFEI